MTSDRSELEPGSVVAATWQVMDVLSATRTSVVYRVRHVRTKVERAMKLLAPRGIEINDLTLARFEREAMVTASLTSANVLRVADFGEVSDRVPFMVMELLEGLTLRDALDARRAAGTPGLPPACTLAIADSVLRGLAEAHSKGLVHRSVKPANLFLHCISESDVVVKLMDFGVAKDLGTPLTSVGDVVGTPTHMSPEQARGRDLDGRSDLYSLGVVLYECLTGKLPFEAPTAVAVAVQHASREPVPIADAATQDVPASLAAVVHKALAKGLTARWDDAIAMRDALGAVVADLGTHGPMADAFKPLFPIFKQSQASEIGGGTIGAAVDETPADTMPLARKIGRRRTRKESWKDDRDRLLASASRVPKRLVSRSRKQSKPPSEERATVMMDSVEVEPAPQPKMPEPKPKPKPKVTTPRRAPTPGKTPFVPRHVPQGRRASSAANEQGRSSVKPEAARPRNDRRKPSARHLATRVNRFAPPTAEAATIVESLPGDERDTVVDGDTVKPDESERRKS